MINNAKVPDHTYIIIESDSCKVGIILLLTLCQFKIWLISMQCQSFVLSALFEHDKGEVCCVGVLAKTTKQREIATGEIFENA